MRNILFKGITVESPQRWIGGDLYRTYGHENGFVSAYIYNPYTGIATQVDADTVCEYSGMNDKLNEPIFEHDRVLVQENKNEAWIGEVVFEEGEFVLEKPLPKNAEGEEDLVSIESFVLPSTAYQIVCNCYDSLEENTMN